MRLKKLGVAKQAMLTSTLIPAFHISPPSFLNWGGVRKNK